jgi:hypothetical protein
MLFMLLGVILYFSYLHFISFWNQIGVFPSKMDCDVCDPMFLILMFLGVLSINPC